MYENSAQNTGQQRKLMESAKAQAQASLGSKAGTNAQSTQAPFESVTSEVIGALDYLQARINNLNEVLHPVKRYEGETVAGNPPRTESGRSSTPIIALFEEILDRTRSMGRQLEELQDKLPFTNVPF